MVLSREGEVAFCPNLVVRGPIELCKSFRRDEEFDGFVSTRVFLQAITSVIDGLWPPHRVIWQRRLNALHRRGASLVRKRGNEFIHQRTLLELAVELEDSSGTSESRILLRAAFSCGLKLFNCFNPEPDIARILNLWDLDILPNIRRGLIDDHYELEIFDARSSRTFSHLHIYLPKVETRPPQPPHSHRFDVGLWALKGKFIHTLYKPILAAESPYQLLRISDSPTTSRAVAMSLWLNLNQKREDLIRAGSGCELRCGSFHSVRVGPSFEPTILLVKFEPVKNAVAFSCTFPGVEEAPKTKQFGEEFFTIAELERLAVFVNNSLLTT